MSSISAIIGAAVVCTMLCVILRRYRPEFAFGVSVLCAILLLLWSLGIVTDVIAKIQSLVSVAQIGNQRLAILLKAVGVCYITQLAKDVCVDSGETAIAGRVDLAGKITIAALSLPLAAEVIELIIKLVK